MSPPSRRNPAPSLVRRGPATAAEQWTAQPTGDRHSPAPSLPSALVLPAAAAALPLAAGLATGQLLLGLAAVAVPAAITGTGMAVITHRARARSRLTLVPPAQLSGYLDAAPVRALPALPAALPAALPTVRPVRPALPAAASGRPAVMRVTLGGPLRRAS